jgi:hypothetical protein
MLSSIAYQSIYWILPQTARKFHLRLLSDRANAEKLLGVDLRAKSAVKKQNAAFFGFALSIYGPCTLVNRIPKRAAHNTASRRSSAFTSLP